MLSIQKTQCLIETLPVNGTRHRFKFGQIPFVPIISGKLHASFEDNSQEIPGKLRMCIIKCNPTLELFQTVRRAFPQGRGRVESGERRDRCAAKIRPMSK